MLVERAKQRKSLAVILERPRGCDDIAKFINDGAVVLEFRNVDSYKVQMVSSSCLYFSTAVSTEGLSMYSRK